MGAHRRRVALGTRGEPSVPGGQKEENDGVFAGGLGADVSGRGGSRGPLVAVR